MIGNKMEKNIKENSEDPWTIINAYFSNKNLQPAAHRKCKYLQLLTTSRRPIRASYRLILSNHRSALYSSPHAVNIVKWNIQRNVAANKSKHWNHHLNHSNLQLEINKQWCFVTMLNPIPMNHLDCIQFF